MCGTGRTAQLRVGMMSSVVCRQVRRVGGDEAKLVIGAAPMPRRDARLWSGRLGPSEGPAGDGPGEVRGAREPGEEEPTGTAVARRAAD